MVYGRAFIVPRLDLVVRRNDVLDVGIIACLTRRHSPPKKTFDQRLKRAHVRLCDFNDPLGTALDKRHVSASTCQGRLLEARARQNILSAR